MSKAAGAGKDNMMDEEMSVAELLVQKAEENQTRKIIDILNEAEDLEDAKETVKALLIK
ncbi:protein phosphatase [Schaedlerella arabinosiphila]|nr:protein phosphatase [Schaedlerella arabinosiphila]